MRKFGLIGTSLQYSYSKEYFESKFHAEIRSGELQYDLMEIQDLNTFMASNTLQGFNVTIPYKQQIIPYLDSIQAEAAELNSVNVVKRTEKGFMGFNTDFPAFIRTSLPLLKPDLKALILGSGASARTVSWALRRFAISSEFLSRNSKDGMGYSDLDDQILKEYKLIINTSPLGTYPQVDKCPDIPYESLDEESICIDLTYNPAKSLFLAKSEQNGARIKNGLEMLHVQADLSYLIWNDQSI
jgi:shikimate dehydrogenase